MQLVQPLQNDTQTQAGLTQAINECFAVMDRNYHGQYRNAFPDNDPSALASTKRLWLNTFKDVNPEDFLRAFKRHIETSKFLPSIFDIKECLRGRAEDMGLPSPRDAYSEACHGNYSHPAVYEAAKGIGFDLRTKPEIEMLPVFKARYEKACERVLRGDVLTMPEDRQIAAPAHELNRDQKVGKQGLAKLREVLA